jgi:hypothetical protein
MVSQVHLKVHGANALQAALIAVPGVGGALERLLFGSLAELRMRRVEQTLEEVGQKLDEIRAEIHVEENEDFANLLEDILPPLGRMTVEEMRVRFRDLLINSAQIPKGDVRWEEARLAWRLLKEIDFSSVTILVLLRHATSAHPNAENCSLSFGENQIMIRLSKGGGSMGKPTLLGEPVYAPVTQAVALASFNTLSSLGLLDHDREKSSEREMRRHGVEITPLGRFLLKWVVMGDYVFGFQTGQTGSRSLRASFRLSKPFTGFDPVHGSDPVHYQLLVPNQSAARSSNALWPPPSLLVDLDMKDEARSKTKRASCGSSEVVTLAKAPRNKELQRCKRQKCSSVPWTLS